jgi:hypothetical protein
LHSILHEQGAFQRALAREVRMRQIAFVAAIFAFGVLGGASSAAPIADSTADFSGIQGANGFSYGYFTIDGDPTTFTTSGMSFDGTFWIGPFGPQPGSTPDMFPFFDANSQHPADGPSSVRRYVASELVGPTLATIAGQYQDADLNGGDSQTVRIYLDGVQLLVDNLNNDGGTLKDFSFTNVLLLPTSTVDLEASRNTEFFFDRTLLTVTITGDLPVITLVPEPAGLGFLTCAAAIVAARLRRRR